MKRLILLLALLIGGDSPVYADKAAVLKIQDDIRAKQKIQYDEYLKTLPQKTIQKVDDRIESTARIFPDRKPFKMDFYLEDHECKVVKQVVEHLTKEGWLVKVDYSSALDLEWIKLEISE